MVRERPPRRSKDTTLLRAIWGGCILFFSLAIGSTALADQVSLKNGDHISGIITSLDGQTLTIKTDYAGDVKIQWAAVTGLESAQSLHLALKDGQTVVGTVTTNDDKLIVATKSTGSVAASKSGVISIRNDADEAVYERQVLHPRLTDLWSGLVDTGFNTTRGNSETLSYNLTAKAARISDKDKITVYTTAIYADNATTGTTITTAHDIQGGVWGDLNVGAREFVFAQTDFQYDEFQDLNLRNTIGGGAGYHAIKTANTTFDLLGGATYEQEYFSTPLTRKSAEVLLGEDFSTKIAKRFTLSENLSLYPDVNSSERGQYRFLFNATAAAQLKGWLSWQFTYNDQFLSNPINGLKKNDAIITTGIRVSFGKAVF
jgi:putative salt-induced outer membrane protein YdiY